MRATDHHQKLVLRIMDKDIFNADDFVGQATINIADVISLGVEKGNGELHPCKYSVVPADRTYYGEIRVGVKFTLKMEEKIAEEFGEGEAPTEEAKKSNHVMRKLEKRQQGQTLDSDIEEQFNGGHTDSCFVYLCVFL